MRKYLKFHGMNIDNGNGLPVFTESPEVAMVNMPDGYWNFLIDPDEVRASERQILQRVTGNVLPSTSGSDVPLSTFPNGAAAFDPQSGSVNFAVVGDVDIRADAWSVAFVVQTVNNSVLSDIINSAEGGTDQAGVGLRVTIVQNGNKINVYENAGRTSGSPVRLDYTSDFRTRGVPALVMVTFSTERGLAIWDNGVQVAHDPTDTRPLTANRLAGEWQVPRAARDRHGLIGQINADLGLPKNAPFRRMIERHCRAKYDIAEIPE